MRGKQKKEGEARPVPRRRLLSPHHQTRKQANATPKAPARKFFPRLQSGLKIWSLHATENTGMCEAAAAI